jgi:hypothetical protein
LVFPFTSDREVNEDVLQSLLELKDFFFGQADEKLSDFGIAKDDEAAGHCA